jgi:tRNA A-37 threonylcarbamoyl transferase component Bud32
MSGGMTAPRIGDHQLARSLQKTGLASTRMERIRAAVASPLGVLVIIPSLVGTLGIFLTLLGQRALRDSNAEMGRARFAEQTGFVARSVAAALSNADPVLDRLHELVRVRSPKDPLPPFAHELRSLMQGRAGMAYASASYPDGTFLGAYIEDGVIRFQESHVTPDGTVVRRYDLEGVDRLVLREETRNTYDPRKRSFYTTATEAKGRTWTKPYPFFKTHYTGETKVQPVYGGDGKLLAVLTADFDVNVLSSSIERTPVAGARTLLYTRDGVILAFPEGVEAIKRLPLRDTGALSHKDIGDVVLDAFFRDVVAGGPRNGEFIEFTAGNETQLAMVTEVPGYPDLGWSAAAIIPEDVFFAARSQHEKKSLASAAVGLLMSLVVAVIFARHITKVRRDMARAERLAKEATARVKELGSYRLVQRLGAGGMGEVWRAEHRLLARHAAIKLIRKEAIEDAQIPVDELRDRFRLEAQTLAMLRSRHTIDLFDYGVTEDGTFFFVMELLEGIDVESLIVRFGPQPAGRVISLLIQACKSLAEAHRAGLVHRDIKPANLFVCRVADEVDVLKVLDFGLVHAGQKLQESVRPPSSAPPSSETPSSNVPSEGGRLTAVGQFMGTPAFMPPEQGLGHEVDGRADLYALACAAIWMLGGKLVFDANDAMGFIMAHITRPVPDLRPLVSG